MEIIDKLYKYDNPKIGKTINIDDGIYDKIKDLSEKVFDATISEIVNIAIEEYIKRDHPIFYGKTREETVTYRTVNLRKNCVDKLLEYNKKTGISFTRLVNAALKEFLDNYKEILYTSYTDLEIQKGIEDIKIGNIKTSSEVRKIIERRK